MYKQSTYTHALAARSPYSTWTAGEHKVSRANCMHCILAMGVIDCTLLANFTSARLQNFAPAAPCSTPRPPTQSSVMHQWKSVVVLQAARESWAPLSSDRGEIAAGSWAAFSEKRVQCGSIWVMHSLYFQCLRLRNRIFFVRMGNGQVLEFQHIKNAEKLMKYFKNLCCISLEIFWFIARIFLVVKSVYWREQSLPPVTTSIHTKIT
jgi:hypothetical protein